MSAQEPAEITLADELRNAIKAALPEHERHLIRKEETRRAEEIKESERCEKAFGFMFQDINENMGDYLGKGRMEREFPDAVTDADCAWIKAQAEKRGLVFHQDFSNYRNDRQLWHVTLRWGHIVEELRAETLQKNDRRNLR